MHSDARPASGETVQSIQVLRGLAAAAVAVYHSCASFPSGPQAAESSAVAVLASGVDVFFVVSGFVMVVATAGRNFTFGQFMAARAWRIVPLYWIALAAYLVVLVALGHRVPLWDEVLQSFLFIPYTNPVNNLPVPFLVPGWTLNYEMLFYVVFGATLFVRSPPRQLAILAVLFGTLVLLRPLVGGSGAIAFRLTSPLLFEFLGGVAIAVLLPQLRRLPVRAYVAFIAVAVIGFALSPGVAETWPRTIYFGVPAVLLVAGAVGLEPWARRAPLAALLLLGDASYSIYLSHSLTIDGLEAAVAGTGIAPPVLAVVAIVLSLAVGLATFALIERPLIDLGRRWRRRRRTMPAPQPLAEPARVPQAGASA